MPAARSARERRIQGGFLLALLCVAAIGIASYSSLLGLTQNQRWVAHSGTVLVQLQLLRTALVEAESAERGYVITGRTSQLEAFAQAAAAVERELQQVRRLTSDNPSQQQRLAEVAPFLSQRLQELGRVIDARRTQGFDAARQVIEASHGKELHDAIWRITEHVITQEATLRVAREQRTRRSAEWTEWTIVVGGGLTFALVGFSMVAIRRDLLGRLRAEQGLRAANERLEAGVRERTAELVAANDLLRTSERRFRAYVDATTDVIYRMSPDWSEMYQLQGQDFISDTTDTSRTWLDKYIHPDDQPLVTETIDAAVRSKTEFNLEHRVLRPDGTLAWTYSRAIPLIEADGEIREWFGAASDITERKEADRKLKAQLARLSLLGHITRAVSERQDVQSIFQVVVRTLEDELRVDLCCICLYDSTDNCLIVTSVGVHSTPLAMELAMPEHARIDIDQNGLSRAVAGELVYEPDVQAVSFPFPERLARGGLHSMVVAPLAAESQVFGVLVTARRAAYSFSSGECEFLRQLSEHVGLAAQQARLYQALQRAYDDLKQTQQTVMEQERLLALGKMASGIAHDINNAISPISLYTESMLEREAGLSPSVRNNLEIIHRAIGDVAQTVTRMREFYRSRTPEQTLQPVDLNSLVVQVVDLTRARWRDMSLQRGVSIDVRTELGADLPPVAGIEGELRDALTNLVFNAVDAMPNGGELRLATRLAGTFVQLDVIDTGIGMDEQTRARCLEPFFTTKGERGTGLGLAMVYGTVQRHGADLEIHSSLGQGTTVRLTFSVPKRSAASLPAPESVATVGPLRVLLVDDDPLILRSLRESLEMEGHRVTAADGGQAGIDAFLAGEASFGDAFQVVITDLGMPYVDGRKVAAAVKAARATAAVVMLTGWGRRMIADGETPAHVDWILSKPPKLRELREVLAQCQQRQRGPHAVG